jgi:hypothetical protein
LVLPAKFFECPLENFTPKLKIQITGGPTTLAFVGEIGKCKTEKPFSYFVVKISFRDIFFNLKKHLNGNIVLE